MRRPAESSLRVLLTGAAVALAGACGGYGGAGADTGDAVYVERNLDARPIGTPVLEEQESGTEALLQAVSPVSDDVVWVSGHRGTYSRTTDGGATWQTTVVPGADSLGFRDVHAESATEAWLLSAGPGALSNVFHTDDAGATWTLQWTNPEPDGFYDCLDFWDAERGALYGDEVDGGLRIMRTENGGETWTRVPEDRLPPAAEGEGGFAASGTCLVVGEGGRGWISTGAADPARVLLTEDYGKTWRAVVSPIRGASAGGLFSISFRNPAIGVAFGGDLSADAEPSPRVAVTSDGGESWTIAGEPSFSGAIFGGAWVPGTFPATMVIVSPNGAEYSADGAHTWLPLDDAAYWGIGFASADAGWIVGPGGRITKVSF